jgi:hypothetical protein
MANYNDLITWRGRLEQALAMNAREVTDSDGSKISYKSTAEIKSAIAWIDSQLAAPAVRAIRFTTSKFGVSRC